MHLIVFQDMNVNYEDYDEPFRFIVKEFPLIDSKLDKEDALLKHIEAYQTKENLELLGIFPGIDSSDSLIVFAQIDESIHSSRTT